MPVTRSGAGRGKTNVRTTERMVTHKSHKEQSKTMNWASNNKTQFLPGEFYPKARLM